MKKGKAGICLGYLAALSFLLVIFNQPLLCGLLMLVAIFVEKDEWLSRQSMQAFLLVLASNLLTSFLPNVFTTYGTLSLIGYSALTIVLSVLSLCVSIIALVFAILAITRVVKENEADIPIAASFAYKAYGFVKPSFTPPVQQYYQPPVQQAPQAQQPPMQQQQTAQQQQPVAPQQPYVAPDQPQQPPMQ